MRWITLLGAVLFLLIPGTEGSSPVFRGPFTERMDEEEDIQTVVPFTFTVTDGDIGDTLTYALSGVDSAKFTIDEQGVIKLAEILDYENGKTTFHLTVDVTDTTNNRVSQNVVLNLNDINDNSPICTPDIIYSNAITENDPADTIVTTLSCSDADGSSPNKAITLSILNKPNQFSLSGNNIITTAVSTDYEDKVAYTLIIKAVDGGRPPNTGTATVFIEIQPLNEHTPVWDSFTPNGHYHTIKEDSLQGKSVVTITATDDDGGTDGVITYTLESTVTDGGTTVEGMFSLDSISGQLSSLSMFDRDDGISSYTVTVRASDSGMPSKIVETRLTITIEDVNEDIETGSVIVRLTASDADSLSGETVTYSITAGNKDSDFVIDPNTGIVYNHNSLNYEWTEEYKLTVAAKDSGAPSRTNTIEFTVKVEDVNEAPPICRTSYVAVSIEEPAAGGHVVTTFSCKDADKHETLTFTITDGDLNVFEVDSKTQQIKLKTVLDYEVKTNYELTVTVEDSLTPIHTVTITVTVFVTPMNEHAPIISITGPGYTAENDDVGDVVRKIRAYDRDKGLYHGTLRYSITEGNELGHFAIDNAGLLTIAKNLDAETTSEYNLIIAVADDVVGSTNAHTVTADVGVRVTDCNDNPPVFNPVLYTVSHMETAQPGTTLATVFSTDDDISGYNSNPSYSILSGDIDNIFEMTDNKQYLQLQSSKSMDYLTRPVHYLVIQVTDQGSPPLTAEAKLIVNVLSVDSNPPVLTGSDTKLQPLSETTAIGTCIFQASASDSDIGLDGFITYSIESGKTPAFDMDSSTGEIFVWSMLDYDTAPINYNLTIKAEDGGGKSDTMWIYIPLKDKNDNTPQFSATVYNLNVDENVGVLTTIAPTIVATDGDSGDSGSVFYYFIEGDGMTDFSIHDTSGIIRTKAKIDYETKSIYTVAVRAVDKGTPANSATCLVIIHVIDLNDNTPVFTPEDVTISVSESASINTPVITVVATDDDSTANLNNKITYSLSDQFFTIHASSGEITTKAQLDRETVARHCLTVKAHDKSNGASGSLTGTSTLTVDVTDVNDNAPVISDGTYDFSILETVSPGSIIVTIAASDLDVGDNARLSYTITDGATNDDFVIEINSGMIQLANVLDRDTTDKYFLEVTVTDHGTPPKSASVTCSVTILDINDNTPTFSKSSYEFTFTENDPLKTVAGSVAATDADTGVNGQFTFEFVNFWVGDSSHFVINKASGEITSNVIIDREKYSVYEILCRVVDAGSPVLSSEVNVTIHVNDLNDNDPLFSSTLYTGTVVENSDVGTTILTMSVTDLDAGVNAHVTLSIDTTDTDGTNANTQLDVDSATWHITLKATLDKEAFSSFVFKVISVDGGTPPRSSSTSVSIHVGDINDNAPIFNPTFYNAEIAYTGECDNIITTVTATDGDSGDNGQVDYYLIQSTYQYLFSVNSAGVVSLQETASLNSTYVIKAGARDNGKPPRTAETQAIIRIDTFDPVEVILFHLNISKADFQKKKPVFLEGLQNIIRAKYPTALVRLWCVQERTGTARPPKVRRRLLQSSPPVTVYVYSLTDETSESVDNINKKKTMISYKDMLTFFTTHSNGSPSSVIKGSAWEYYGIDSVKQYYQRKTPWEETSQGMAIIIMIVFFIVLFIALLVFLLWWNCCRNQSSSVESEEDPPVTDIPEDDNIQSPTAKEPKTPNYVRDPYNWSRRPYFCTVVDPDTGSVYEYNTGTKKRIALKKPKKIPKKKFFNSNK